MGKNHHSLIRSNLSKFYFQGRKALSFKMQTMSSMLLKYHTDHKLENKWVVKRIRSRCKLLFRMAQTILDKGIFQVYLFYSSTLRKYLVLSIRKININRGPRVAVELKAGRLYVLKEILKET